MPVSSGCIHACQSYHCCHFNRYYHHHVHVQGARVWAGSGSAGAALLTIVTTIIVTVILFVIDVAIMCRVLEFGPDQGLQGQVVDIVRMLLDPDSMDHSPEKDPFLELFYDKYVGELINLLIEGAEQNQQHSQEQLDAFRRQEQVSIWLLDLAGTYPGLDETYRSCCMNLLKWQE